MIEVTPWAAVCVGVWLLALSSVTLPDLGLAMPAGLLCGLLAASGRRLAGGRWHPQPRWAAWLITLPVTVIAETLGVWRAAGRAALDPARSGRERLSQLPTSEPDNVAAARCGLATLALSASPGSYVINLRPRSSRVDPHPGGQRPRLGTNRPQQMTSPRAML